MRRISLSILLLMLCSNTFAQKPKIIVGEGIASQIYRYENFKSINTGARNVDVWVPLNYSNDRKYAVLYVNDGQNLFNPKDAFQGIEWGMDETLQRLMFERRVRETIVVGIWSTQNRLKEFSPEKAFTLVNSRKTASEGAVMPPGTGSDAYLKFIVEELKPFIDKNYPTRTEPENTFIMGSSMGALMALYAIGEYPKTFGGAACVSTHFPLGRGVMVEYMRENLPLPDSHRIYFDYGTVDLDAEYEPYQKQADQIMREKGYVENKNWTTRKVIGGTHTEMSWGLRVYAPLEFLLKQ